VTHKCPSIEVACYAELNGVRATAKAFGVSKGTVRYRLFKARQDPLYQSILTFYRYNVITDYLENAVRAKYGISKKVD
jgi:hypothetical protein